MNKRYQNSELIPLRKTPAYLPLRGRPSHFLHTMRVNNIPKSVTLHIPFKSHFLRESQHQHFIEHQRISCNFKQINLHQQIYSFQTYKQIFHTAKGMQHRHVSPRVLYQAELSSKRMVIYMRLYRATIHPIRFNTALDKIDYYKAS